MNEPLPIEATLESVRRHYQNLNIRFTSATYWETLWSTYIRTVRDVVQLSRTHFKTEGKLRVLEIGAFCGIVATSLKRIDERFDVTAWDLPLFMEDEALKAHYGLEGIHQASGNLSQLPLDFQAEEFDIILCCEVVEHLNFNPLPVYCEFNRLLKPGGVLYIGTPNQANIVKRLLLARGKSIHNPIPELVWQLDPKSSFSIGLHWKEYTATELIQVVQLTGFELIKAYFCHTNTLHNPNPIRRLLVRAMYACWPSFLPSQVVIASKKTTCNVQTLTGIK